MSNRQCPICHHGINAVQNNKSVSELKKTAATYGGKFAGKQVGGVIGSFVGSAFGLEDVGYELGAAAGGFLTGEAINDHYSTHRWDGTYTYTCPHCGLEWHSSRQDQVIVNAVLSRKREDEKIHFSAFFGAIAMMIIPPILTWACWYYCHTHETQTFDYNYSGELTDWSINWLWYILGLLMIIFGIASLAGICSGPSDIGEFISDYKNSLKIRKMSLEEYVRNKRHLFTFLREPINN